MRRRFDGVEAIKQVVFYFCGLSIVSVVLAGLALALLVLGSSYRPALSQHNHARHHAHYQSWFNSLGRGCCNNTDCREIADGDERERQGVLEVRVEGEWCPVLPHHYLSKGNVPDASVSHACVSGHYGGKTPCEKFICYQPKPRS